MTVPGAASKPPSFDVHPKSAKARQAEPTEISDGRVPSPAERWASQHKRDLTGIHPDIRKDHSRLQAVLAQQALAAEGESELTSWDELQQRDTAWTDDRRVDFSGRPSMEPSTGYDDLGRPFPRTRNRVRNALRHPQ
jgi:hypothetical protein